MVHRVRERLVKARTALTKKIRGLLQEYGIVFPQGFARLRAGLLQLLGSSDGRLSELTRQIVQRLVEERTAMERTIDEYEAIIMGTYRSREMRRRLRELLGVGPITATAMVATVGDPGVFKNGRQLSAFLGLVPRHDGTGGQNTMKSISKQGDRYVRKLLVHGARAALRATAAKPSHRHRWVVELAERRGFNKACVALANKNARRCFAIMAGRESREDVAARGNIGDVGGEYVPHSGPAASNIVGNRTGREASQDAAAARFVRKIRCRPDVIIGNLPGGAREQCNGGKTGKTSSPRTWLES